jgi:hypothetical protein
VCEALACDAASEQAVSRSIAAKHTRVASERDVPVGATEPCKQNFLFDLGPSALRITALPRLKLRILSTPRLAQANIWARAAKREGDMRLTKVALAVFVGFWLGAFMMASAHAQAAPPVFEGESTRKEPKGVIGPKDEFTLTWSGAQRAGSCTIEPGATLAVRSDGTATWTAFVTSTDNDNAYGIGLFLIDVHNVTLFGFPKFYSQTLRVNNRLKWTRDIFFPSYMFQDIDHATRGAGSC